MERPTIILTGASQGIGAAAARIAARRGAQLVLAARNREALERAAVEVATLGGTAVIVAGDVSDWAVCQEIVHRAVATFGRIDALINNAGIIGPLTLVAELPVDEWKQTFEVDLFGAVWLCREAVPHLRLTDGRIVNVSSGAAVNPVTGGSAYCSAKAALLQFSKVLALEEQNLTILSYYPGEVDTHMQAEIRSKTRVGPFEDIHRYFVEQYEQGRLMSPEQSALAVVALALGAPKEWSGEFLSDDEARIQDLTRHFFNG